MADERPANLLHTPSQGFVDIKPVIDNPIWVTRLGQSLTLVIAAFIAYFLARAIIKKLREKTQPGRNASPLEIYNDKVSSLKNNNLTVREFSESLSTAVRSFCDSCFFSDSDACVSRTVYELEHILRPAISKKLPVYPLARKNESLDSLLKLLKKLEDGSYSDFASKIDSASWRDEMLASVSAWVKNMATELDREYKRTMLVSESQQENAEQLNPQKLNVRQGDYIQREPR